MLEVLTTAQTGRYWRFFLICPLNGMLMPKVLGGGEEGAAIMANM